MSTEQTAKEKMKERKNMIRTMFLLEEPSQKSATEQIPHLRKELREYVAKLSMDEIRSLVDMYYEIQDHREAASNQEFALTKTLEPSLIFTWAKTSLMTIEEEIKRWLDVYTDDDPTGMGQWAKSQWGIGPVIAAALLAYIRMERTAEDGKVIRLETAGDIWAYAGLVPGMKREKGVKIHWNPELKKLAWKIGESFVKVSGKKEAYYGQKYLERKQYEQTRNETGLLADEADKALVGKTFRGDTLAILFYKGNLHPDHVNKVRDVIPSTEWVQVLPQYSYETRMWTYPSPTGERRGKLAAKLKEMKRDSGIKMLPPAHIHSRAKRWAVKLFLAHWFEEAHRRMFKSEPPLPYPIAHLGHAHRHEVPNSIGRQQAS